MTWRPDASYTPESDKIAAIAVPYLQGRALDLGCGKRKVWPGLLGLDNGRVFGRGGADLQSDITDLSMFADASMDAIFSSHAIEDFPRERIPAILTEWARVLKVGGNLVLYVPSANLYPKIGKPGANTDHKWDIFPGDIEAILKSIADYGTCGWELVESEERGDTDEYSLFIVARKRSDHLWIENVWQRNPGGKKRALVIRYGAIGDALQTSSIFPGLKALGYHLTVNCKPSTRDILREDPHVDDWMVQGQDFVPNDMLGPYWATIAQRYDYIVNLCESIEGTLLTLPGRLTHQYPQEVRRKLFGGVNYMERLHDLAGLPHQFRSRFYPTLQEVSWGHAVRGEMNGPVVCWALAGSSGHKIYPFTQHVVAWLVQKLEAHIVLLGDGDTGVALQSAMLGVLERDGGVDMAHVHPMAGEWPIRKTLTFVQIADCIVGPETGVLNAVAFQPMPKVIYLSHSSEENLTKHWRNTTTLLPSVDCYPCHRLHYDWEWCPQDEETFAAACASSIKPEAVFEAIAEALTSRFSKVA